MLSATLTSRLHVSSIQVSLQYQDSLGSGKYSTSWNVMMPVHLQASVIGILHFIVRRGSLHGVSLDDVFRNAGFFMRLFAGSI